MLPQSSSNQHAPERPEFPAAPRSLHFTAPLHLSWGVYFYRAGETSIASIRRVKIFPTIRTLAAHTYFPAPSSTRIRSRNVLWLNVWNWNFSPLSLGDCRSRLIPRARFATDRTPLGPFLSRWLGVNFKFHFSEHSSVLISSSQTSVPKELPLFFTKIHQTEQELGLGIVEYWSQKKNRMQSDKFVTLLRTSPNWMALNWIDFRPPVKIQILQPNFPLVA